MSEMVAYWLAGGPLMIPLAVICFATWFWVVALSVKLREIRHSSGELHRTLHDAPPHGVHRAVSAWAERRAGLLARIARYALRGIASAEAVRDRLTEARLAEVSRFSLQLGILRALVAGAPLLGLLGTVKGMITTFLVLSARGAASIELISTGISEALVTTQVGLVIALPGLFGAYAVQREIRDLETTLDRLESHLVAASVRTRARQATGEREP